VICPQCSNEVPVTEAQFLSMYTCPKCQAVYFIDIVGQPEFGDMSLPIPENPILPVDPSVEGETVESPQFAQPEYTPMDSSLGVVPDNQLQTTELNEVVTHGSLESMSTELTSDQNPFAIPEASPFSDFNSTAMEITDFANQDNTIAAISYDLKISGLDTKETMLMFREAVDDSKFGWIPQEIFSMIENGQCEIKNLNPIQAFVLAKRIQFLDLEMDWKQNVQG
jgi:hypothetical protein